MTLIWTLQANTLGPGETDSHLENIDFKYIPMIDKESITTDKFMSISPMIN